MAPTPIGRRGFLALSGLTALAPIIAACGADSGDGTTTIDWWNLATTEPRKTVFPRIAKAYGDAHPGVTIASNALENEAFKSKMTANTASGKLPDIFHTWGGGVLKQRIDAGLIEDLTTRLDWAGDLTGSSLSPFQFDGKTYAVPFNATMVGFWYNKRLFADAGIDTPPTTWSGFLDAVGKLKAKGTTPIALAGKEKWPGHFYWSYLAMRTAGIPALAQAATTNDFTAPGFITAGQRLKELVDLAPFQPGFLGAAYDGPGGQAATVGSGKAAMELMGPWAPATQNNAGGGLGADLGFFTFPTVEGGPGTATEVLSGADGFAIRKDAPKEALDFLKFFVKDNEATLIAGDDGEMPVIKGAENQLTDPNKKIVAQELARATGFQLYLDQALAPAVGQEVNDSVAALIAGTKTPEQVAESITKAAKSG